MREGQTLILADPHSCGLATWLVVMVTAFPLAGSGLFGLGFGLAAPLSTLLAHVVCGVVIGATHAWLGGVF